MLNGIIRVGMRHDFRAESESASVRMHFICIRTTVASCIWKGMAEVAWAAIIMPVWDYFASLSSSSIHISLHMMNRSYLY